MAKSKKTDKYKIGVALSGGGARGFAHLGALKAIEDMGLKPDIISGTSAGALAGVFYADGYAPEEIVHLFIGREFKEFADIQVPKMGIFGNAGLKNFLKKHLRTKNFEDLQIPLRVIATNLDEGKRVVFEKGPLVEPVAASCCIPIVFNPVVIDGACYVDGGVFMNFPVTPIRSISEMIIGVNVSPIVSGKYNKTIMGIAERSYHYMSRTNTLLDRTLCDVLIEMDDLYHIKTFDLENSETVFRIGYDHAWEALLKADEQHILSVRIPDRSNNKKQ